MLGGFWCIENVRDYDDLWQEASNCSLEENALRVTWIPTRETADGKAERLNDLTATLIWLLPAIEIEEITEDNQDEVFTRLRMLEIAIGTNRLKGDDGERHMLSLQHVRRHIGLRVGAGMEVSPFAERLVGFLRTQATDDLNSERKFSDKAT
jgi:hypothetical protein